MKNLQFPCGFLPARCRTVFHQDMDPLLPRNTVLPGLVRVLRIIPVSNSSSKTHLTPISRTPGLGEDMRASLSETLVEVTVLWRSGRAWESGDSSTDTFDGFRFHRSALLRRISRAGFTFCPALGLESNECAVPRCRSIVLRRAMR